MLNETKAKLEDLAKFIEQIPEEHFNMRFWASKNGSDYNRDDSEVKLCPIDLQHGCGTACCIAGWVVIQNNLCLDGSGRVYETFDSPQHIGYASVYARKALGLNEWDADRLFLPWCWPPQFEITPKGAAAYIRYLIENGT